MSLLSIVLPAYNEEQNIANTAKVLGELLEQHGIDYELVFISDGSKDGTFERIKEESAKNPRVRGAEFPGILERKPEFCRPGADYGGCGDRYGL